MLEPDWTCDSISGANDATRFMSTRQLTEAVRAQLTPDLLKPAFRFMDDPANPTAGHCYHAAEALWHLLGGGEAGWRGQVHRETDGITHWWLRHIDTGEIADPTAAQYQDEPLPYERGLGKGCGFLTSAPSQRARELIRRVTFSAD